MSKKLYIAILMSIVIHSILAIAFTLVKPVEYGQKDKGETLSVLGVINFYVPPETIQEPQEVTEDIPEQLVIDPIVETVADTSPLIETTPTNTIMKQEVEIVTTEEKTEEIITQQLQELPSGKQQLASGLLEDAKTKYLAKVINRLEQLKKYPPPAYRRGAEGTAHIKFIINNDGSATAIQLTKSSRNYLLDDESKKLITRAAPFASIPTELHCENMTVVLPITFKIKH